MITQEVKQRIIEALKQRLPNFPSAAKMAVSLGINSAQLSRILKGELTGVLSDANWLSLARQMDISLRESDQWKTAETPTYKFIYAQLKACQDQSLSGLLCDKTDIGKTYTAVRYSNENKGAIYVDCSQYKSKQKLVKKIAKELGVNHCGKYNDVYADLIFYLQSTSNILIILDEVGDLEYSAFLELKSLWNAVEYECGWYMMGADALKAKIEKNMENNKVGYAELFSRFGSRFQKATPDGADALINFTQTQVAMITAVNNPAADPQKIYANTNGSLRRIRTELRKLKSN